MKGAKRLDDKNNVELVYEQGVSEDGSGENIELGSKGIMRSEESGKYKMGPKEYDGKRMRRAMQSIDIMEQQYNLLGIGGEKNNCQDYADALRERYRFLRTAEKH